jgi:ABC-2 type transport system permease protein
MWNRLRTLIIKELQAIVRDPAALRLLIMPVIFQTVLFPFAATLDVRNASVAVFNQDSGKASVEIMQRLAAAEAFGELRQVTSESELRTLVDRQTVLLGLRFPPTFSRDLARGKSGSLQVIGDGRRSNSAQLAQGYIDQIVQGYVADNRPATTRAATHPPGRAQVITRNWYNPNLEGRWAIITSMVAIMTTLGALITTALSVAREREQGTLDQVLVSPLSPALIMVGKTIPAVIIACVQATAITLIAIFVFGVPFTGSVVTLYAGMLLYALALCGFGLFISSISATQQQAFLGVFTFMMPAILLSGFIAPVANMPVWLQWVSWIDPLRHFIVIVKGVFLKGSSFIELAPSLWPIALIAIATLGTAYVIFRKGTA